MFLRAWLVMHEEFSWNMLVIDSVVANPTDSARPRSTTALSLGLAAAALAVVCVFQGVQQVLVPFQVQQIDAPHKVRDVALLTTLAAAFAVAGSVAGGALSDRTRSRFGRRTPWLVVMALLSGMLLITAGALSNVLQMAVVYSALWFCLNFYQAAVSAIIPDKVPARSRGAVSSAIGLGGALGLGLGVGAVAHFSPAFGFMALCGLMIIATCFCVVLIREGARPGLAGPAYGILTNIDSISIKKPSPIGLLQPFLDRDFVLAFATRALIFTAAATVGGYTYYLLQDHVGTANLPHHDVKRAIGILVGAQTVAWLVGAAGAGWLADRLDRRKLFVGASSIGAAFSMLVPLLAPTWLGMLAFYILLGFFLGIYLSVDMALMTLVLPCRENEGRDLAVLSIANAGPQLLSPTIAAAIISMAGYEALFVFGMAASLLAGVAVLFIRGVR
jgi:MFS family permease